METKTAADTASSQKPKEMAVANVTAALNEAIVKILKAQKEPFPKMREFDQQSVINALDNDIRNEVRKAVNLIAADKRPVLEALIDTVTVKDGIKATLKLAKSQGFRHELIDAQGAGCLVIITDPGKFMKGNLPKADKDQKDLLGKESAPAPKVKPKKDERTKRVAK